MLKSPGRAVVAALATVATPVLLIATMVPASAGPIETEPRGVIETEPRGVIETEPRGPIETEPRR